MTSQTMQETFADWKCLIGGEFHASGRPLEVRSPYDNSVVAVVSESSEDEIQEAIRHAQAAFAKNAGMPTHQKAAILHRMAAEVERRREELVRILALEAGKPVKAGRAEVERAIFNFHNFAEESQRIENEYFPLDVMPSAQGRWALVRRVPLGPVLAISPFNFPLNLVVHKIGPALAAGNAVVQKPSPKTPLSSFALAQVAQAADVPNGMLNVICCSNERAAQLVADERFKLLTFTGSSEVGWKLKSLAGKKRVALELGGNAGAIVHSDADLEYAADRCVLGGFSFSGQSCISVQRILVHRPAFDRFLPIIVDRVRALIVGNPLDEKTDVGPLITHEAALRVEAWVKEAVEGGAKLLSGGKRDGNIVQPIVLTNTQAAMRVNCCEAFGPLVTVEAFDSLEQAFTTINDSPYGLQAGIFTQDVRNIFAAFEKLDVGGVIANDMPSFRADHMPYGGSKDSGQGREGSKYAIEEMTERKILVLNFPK